MYVFDPTDQDGHVIPHGKQALVPSHIWYTPCSGLWQSVWMESVPDTYVTKLDVRAAMDGKVTAMVHSSSNRSVPTTIAILDEAGGTVQAVDGMSDQPVEFTVDAPRLWSPDQPNLYNISVRLGADQVASYTGFRTLRRGDVAGVQRPLLNDAFVFLFGTLDQGFWPDGIYTAPTHEAMVSDLILLKSLGMNMVRKHVRVLLSRPRPVLPPPRVVPDTRRACVLQVKVEPQLFYEACDRLGLLVIQDMPSMTAGATPDAAQQAEFERQLLVMVDQLKNHPAVATWVREPSRGPSSDRPTCSPRLQVIYNEGWAQLRDHGQYPEVNLTRQIRAVDPTRLVDAVTGWFDHGAGDFSDNHHYAEPQCGTPWYSADSSPTDPSRIAIQGERERERPSLTYVALTVDGGLQASLAAWDTTCPSSSA